MPLSHLLFLLANLAIAAAIWLVDRTKIRHYALLCLFGLAAAFIFETFTTLIGFWIYHSEPKVFVISLYTWLLYIPYLSFCYFIGGRLAGGNDGGVRPRG